MAGGTDFHSHLMPGVDDGAATLDESVAALEAFGAAGVSTVITTPHFEGSLTKVPALCDARLAELDAAWAQLQADPRVAASGVTLHRGVELMLDVPDPDVADPRLRLAGTRYVLVEFPAMQLPESHPEVAVRALRDAGVQPVIAHPERYRNPGDAMAGLGALRYAGALFQLNGGSLIGLHGRGAQQRAMELLAHGWIDYASSDFHARGEPAVRAARAALRAMGREQDSLLFDVNPARLLAGESPMSVPPLVTAKPSRPWWSRWFRP